MSKFTYTLPSGSKFSVTGPANATQLQADQVFYEQVAAGSLVNYSSGQSLTSAASKLTKFELSRLDRGIAGVDAASILSVVQGLPIVSGIPSLVNIPIQNPVNQTDIVLAKGNTLGPDTVGPLSSFQIQTLQAQIINLVDQSPTEITQDKGIGQYGFNCYQLEQTGYVKPGTSAKLLNDNPDNFVSVMSSPGIWTGLNGISSLDSLLSDPDAQTIVQTDLMQTSYESLTASGVISSVPAPAVSTSTGQVYTQGGLQTISALALLGSGTALAGLNALLSSPVSNLSTLASGAVNDLTTGLSNLSALASGAVNNLTTGISNLANLNFGNLATDLQNKITGDVGSLITNASKFGTEATALWANAGGLGSSLNSLSTNLTNFIPGSLTNLTGGLTSVLPANLTSLTNLTGGLTSVLPANLTGLTTSLTNLVPGSLSNLNSSLDIFGKASQFSLNFSSPLTGALGNLEGLASGALGDIQGLASGALGDIQGLGTEALANLEGLASGALGDIQSLASGALGDLSGVFGSLGGLSSLGGLASLGSLFGGGGDLVSGSQVAAGFSNTVNRTTVDAAFTRILGSSKISVPVFEYPSLPSLTARLDITQAQNILQDLKRQSTQILG